MALTVSSILAPVQSLIWYGADAPPWISGIGRAVNWIPAASAELAEPTATYFAAGRILWIAYAALLLAVSRWADRVATRLATVLTTSVGVAFVGDVVAYGLSQITGSTTRTIGLVFIEMPALAVALVAVCTIGVKALRSGATTSPTVYRLRSRSAAAFAATPLMAVAALALVQYLPHAVLVPLSVAAIILVNSDRPADTDHNEVRSGENPRETE